MNLSVMNARKAFTSMSRSQEVQRLIKMPRIPTEKMSGKSVNNVRFLRPLISRSQLQKKLTKSLMAGSLMKFGLHNSTSRPHPLLKLIQK